MENSITYYGFGRDNYINILQCIKEEGEDSCTPTNTTRIDMTGHDPLMCSDGICNYIDYENSRIVRYVKKYIFTGSENNFGYWQNQNIENTKGIYWFSSTVLGLYSNPKVKSNVGFCSHFQTISGYSAYIKDDRLRHFVAGMADPPYISFRIPIDLYMKAWLTEQYNAGTPVISY